MSDRSSRQGDAIDSRYHPSAAMRRQLNKVFPTLREHQGRNGHADH
jgi:ubiquinol-cytochrome c reductase cytochrome b subunit